MIYQIITFNFKNFWPAVFSR